MAQDKKVPDYLHSQEWILSRLAKDELVEYYLNKGYSEEDSRILAGIIEESDEESNVG